MSRRRRSSVLTDEQQDFLARRIANRPNASNPIVQRSAVASKLSATAKALEREIVSDRLKEQLYCRPEPEDSGVASKLPSNNVAPGIRAAKMALERSITQDQIGSLLRSRPDQGDLISAGILPEGAEHSSRIQQARKLLERSMTKDKLGHLLEKRSELEDLVHEGKYKNTELAPALHQASQSLQRNLAKSNLYHALKYRSSVVELMDRGIIPANYYDYGYDDGSGDQQAPYGDYAEEEYGYNPYGYEADEYGAAQQYADQSGYTDQSVYTEQSGYTDQSGYADQYDQEAYDQAAYEEEQYDRAAYADYVRAQHEAAEPVYEAGHQRRSKNFHLTRILLKFVASMAEAGEISLEEKGFLKDLIVDQDQTILAVAETFDAENDLHDFKDSLVRLASR